MLCDPMNCSMPGLPVHHQLPEFTQTHVHRVSNAIQPSHPLLSPSPPAFDLSQHQEIFKWVSSSHQVAKVLELQIQHQSIQWLFRIGFLEDGLVGSPCSPRDSQESLPTPQLKNINSLALGFARGMEIFIVDRGSSLQKPFRKAVCPQIIVRHSIVAPGFHASHCWGFICNIEPGTSELIMPWWRRQ